MNLNRPITVAGCQILQIYDNPKANIHTAIEAISGAPGHDIYVLPELSNSGYDEIVRWTCFKRSRQ
jgi:predicted amidohydrolase